jgi:hypothetical protein
MGSGEAYGNSLSTDKEGVGCADCGQRGIRHECCVNEWAGVVYEVLAECFRA